jgi:osmotically inducible lipoprotein OsmB
MPFSSHNLYPSCWRHPFWKRDGTMNTRIALPVIALAATVALAGCGTTTGDRGLSGAGIGAAGGAVVGAMVGAPLAGAAIGAGAGAVAGAVTSPSTIDLGKPVWEK